MSVPSPRLADLVRRLDALGPDPSLADIARVMGEVRLTAADVAEFVRPDHQSYHRGRVARRDQYELLVMTWLPGQGSVPHDHTGSVCAMQVVQGEAVEGSYVVAADGYADLEYEAVVRAGEVSAGQDAGVHTVRNPPAADGLLVTVHVYAPPLREIRRFVPRPADPEPRPHPGRPPTVLVVGGGFSGSMTAAHVLSGASRVGGRVRVVLAERRGAVAEGVAYGTREPVHLLNVPAGRMSAWPDRPDDFARWAARRDGGVQPGDFLPRQWYGEYVRETLLDAAREAVGAELSVVPDEVRRVARHPAGGWMVHLVRGASIRAEAVVLAVGHRPPSDPLARVWVGPRDRFIPDPWRPFAANEVGADEPVVVLGSGLTAIDAVLSLAQRPRTAPITLVSRRGLLPQAHADSPVPPADLATFVARQLAAPAGLRVGALCRDLRRAARERVAAGGDWRSVIDGLRPYTEKLWRALSTAERRRFLAHLRPIWEVHRHRMAPAVADRVRSLLDCGAVRVVAGRVVSAVASAGGVRLAVRTTGGVTECEAGWVINCTGPVPSNSAEANPAIGSLLVHGWVRPDELALGLETTTGGNAIDGRGREVPDLFVVGTLRKPGSWESTAVPELREQAAEVGGRVLKWVSRCVG